MDIDSRAIRLLAAQGLNVAEIARSLGQDYGRVRWITKSLGIAVRIGRVPENVERNARMVPMYRQGVTLQKIGDTFGLTRERVRQLLRQQGVIGADGGAHVAAQAKADAAKAKQDARYLTRHGLTFDEYKKALKAGLVYSYRNQHRAALARGIEWDLPLAQWLGVWNSSGHLEQRGKGKGKYVMSRIKDTGGYVVGNVHIQLATDNSTEAVEKWRGKEKANRGVFHLYPGLSRPYMAKAGRVVIGRFASEDEAVAARVKYAAANGLEFDRTGRLCQMRQAA
jgi:hypothetical protein